MPVSKSPAFAKAREPVLFRKTRAAAARRPDVTGRRNARRASVVRIVRAQAASSFAVLGSHVKIFERLAVTPRPDVSYGPPITSCLTSGVPPGTSNRLTRAPSRRRSTGYGTCGTPPRPAPPPRRRTFALDLQIFARRRDAHPVKSRFHRDAHLIRIDLRIVLADRRSRGMRTLNDIFAIHGKVMLY